MVIQSLAKGDIESKRDFVSDIFVTINAWLSFVVQKITRILEELYQPARATLVSDGSPRLEISRAENITVVAYLLSILNNTLEGLQAARDLRFVSGRNDVRTSEENEEFEGLTSEVITEVPEAMTINATVTMASKITQVLTHIDATKSWISYFVKDINIIRNTQCHSDLRFHFVWNKNCTSDSTKVYQVQYDLSHAISVGFGSTHIPTIILIVALFVIGYRFNWRDRFYRKNKNETKQRQMMMRRRFSSDGFNDGPSTASTLRSRCRSESHGTMTSVYRYFNYNNTSTNVLNVNDCNVTISNSFPEKRQRGRSDSFSGGETFMNNDEQQYSTNIYRDLSRREEYLSLGVEPDLSSNIHSLYRPREVINENSANKQLKRRNHLKYFGPTVNSIQYCTISPPPSWKVASRHLVMGRQVNWTLQRTISLVFSKNKPLHENTLASPTSTLVSHGYDDKIFTTTCLPSISCASIVIQETPSKSAAKLTKSERKLEESKRIEFPVQSISVITKLPAEGGVLELYQVTNDTTGETQNIGKVNEEEWRMEHTFRSASAAAQFQLDLLALQLLWPAIFDMYQAFAVVHKGSSAYSAGEPVLHKCEETTHVLTQRTDAVLNVPVTSDKVDHKPTDQNVDNSKSYNTEEQALNTPPAEESGIAWDDVMRCLGGSFPSIQKRLDALWWIVFLRGGTIDNGDTQIPPQPPSDIVPPTPRPRLGTATSQTYHDENVRNASATTKTAPAPQGVTYGIGPALEDDDLENRYIGGTLQLESSYMHHRILLGPIDFFRLFVPILPVTAIPSAESSRSRVEQMLCWMKRVARAAVLVHAYTKARIIVNLGWKVCGDIDLSRLSYMKQRLGYDDNFDNQYHDDGTSDEYYEPRVSHDLFCVVRGIDFTTKSSKVYSPLGLLTGLRFSSYFNEGSSLKSLPRCSTKALSSYQGFSHVGTHVFHWPSDDISLPLHYTKDPVLSIPSLRTIIEKNPDLEFFVQTVFLLPKNLITVNVFVRSLAKGVDPKFDKVLHNFFHGDSIHRSERLEVLIQLKMKSRFIAFSSRIILWLISFFLKISLFGQRNVPQFTTSISHDAASVPAMKLSLLGKCFHFGGSIQDSISNLPQNYVSSTLLLDSKSQSSFAGRVVLAYVAGGYLSQSIADICYYIAGETKEELPERILGVVRFVKMTFQQKLSMASLSNDTSFRSSIAQEVTDDFCTTNKVNNAIPSLLFGIFIRDPLLTLMSTSVKLFHQDMNDTNAANTTTKVDNGLLQKTKNTRSPGRRKNEKASNIISSDPLEQAVNELIYILDGVRVPIRKDQLSKADQTRSLTSSPREVRDENNLASDPSFIQMSILRRVSRSDIHRFFIACNCNLKTAAVRIVESAAWRGMNFPIDHNRCRVELQSGQFFQQGRDLAGSPVFYFRSTLLGPWRKNEDATIAAVLHRLEVSLRVLDSINEHVRCTLIVVMGKPCKMKDVGKEIEDNTYRKGLEGSGSVQTGPNTAASTNADDGAENMFSDGGSVFTSGEETAFTNNDGFEKGTRAAPINNPRIPSDEQWTLHVSQSVIERLVNIVMKHYPERLKVALVVIGHGNKAFVRTSLGGILSLASLVKSSKTREKVKFLTRYRDLQQYVPQRELITLVGGTQQIDPKHFECLRGEYYVK